MCQGRAKALWRLRFLFFVSLFFRGRKPPVHTTQRTRQSAQGKILECLQRKVRGRINVRIEIKHTRKTFFHLNLFTKNSSQFFVLFFLNCFVMYLLFYSTVLWPSIMKILFFFYIIFYTYFKFENVSFIVLYSNHILKCGKIIYL